MAKKIKDKSISKMFGSIAAAQTMCETFPTSFGVSEKGFTCSIDLLVALFELCSDVPLKDLIVSKMTENVGDSNCTWLQGIEETVKLAIELNLVNLLTCEMKPLIPDKLIGGASFLLFGESSLPFTSEGITIPVSAIDFTGLLQNSPTDETAASSRAMYMSCYDSNSIKRGEPRLLETRELWKHDDFNAFLWYVKNMGVYNNVTERQKLMWDNRYKTKPYTKYERKPEEFFTMDENSVIPFNGKHLREYNENPNTKYKKKQILECRYIEGDGVKSDSFQFRLAASNYYKTRKLTGKKREQTKIFNINKTIFEFNHDFLMSLKLFDAKTYLSQIIQTTFGQGNLSFNFSIGVNDNVIDELINNAIEKVISIDDTEIDDCAFSFSNEEYDMMIQNTINKRIRGENNSEITNDLYSSIDQYDLLMNKNDGVQEENTKTIINNVFNQVCTEIEKGNNTSSLSIGFDYDYKFELIRMLVYPLIKPIFSPKVITLVLINTYVMGNPLKLGEKIITFNDLIPYFQGIIVNIIKQVKDIIVEMLYSWVIDKLIPLLTIFSLRVIMEQLEYYKQLINDMIISCMGVKLPFSGNSGIGNVDYVDINPELEKLKQTAVSNTNC